MLILTMQGFGQHEPLAWLDLHGCSFVEPWAAWRTRMSALPMQDIRYKAGLVSRHVVNPAHQEACGGAK